MRHAARLVLLAALLLPCLARAQSDVDQVREFYRRGTAAYEAAKYDEAILNFQRAYELRDEPVFLFNIAQSHRMLRHHEDALNFYRAFLRRQPDAPNRAVVEQRIAEAQKAIDEKKAKAASEPVVPQPVQPVQPTTPPPPTVKIVEPGQKTIQELPIQAEEKKPIEIHIQRPAQPEPTPEPAAPVEVKVEPAPTPTPAEVHTPERPDLTKVADTDDHPGRGLVAGGTALAIIGGLTAVGGVVCGVLAMNKSEDQERSPIYNPKLESDGKLLTTIGYALDGGGGGLFLIGVILAGVGASKKPEPKSAWVPRLGPGPGTGLAGASLKMEF